MAMNGRLVDRSPADRTRFRALASATARHRDVIFEREEAAQTVIDQSAPTIPASFKQVPQLRDSRRLGVSEHKAHDALEDLHVLPIRIQHKWNIEFRPVA